MSDRGAEFAQLVKLVLSGDRSTPWTIKETSEEVGMTEDVFRSRLREDGRTIFSADEIRRVLSHVPDLRLVRYFLEDTPFLAVERPEPTRAVDDKDIHLGATRAVIEATDILREVERGLSDEKLDHIDLHRIRIELSDAERALGALRARLSEFEERSR